ncbi:unnamed protein product, partial [marine sediment metagenome]
MHKKAFFVFGLLFILVVVSSAGTGTTGWWILRRPQSTKPQPITSVASIRGDLSGVFYNPSILGTIKQKEIFLLTELGLASDTFGSLLYGNPIDSSSGFSIGVVYYDAGKETLSWMESGALKEATVTMQQDMLGLISYGKTLSKSFLAGITLKFATSKIAEIQSSSVYCLDLGFMFLGNSGLTFSFALQNIGSSEKFLNESDELPMSVWAGCSYGMAFSQNSYLALGVDVPYIVSEGRTIPSVGIEFGFGKFSINSGYRTGVDD